jgi:hypothetical protein
MKRSAASAARNPADERVAGRSRGKLAAMWAILLLLPILALLLLTLGYYTVAKLTYPAYACGSFAQLDGELGWVLKPSATSCIGHRGAFAARPSFEAPVHTDANGFRAARVGGETPVGGLVAVGSSYTFGYGVSYEQSYPGVLERLTGSPVVIVGSPAYSAAQTLLLAQRWIPRLRPKALVYSEMGAWMRNACTGMTPPIAILKPCFWRPPGSTSTELVAPPPGRVERWARWGVVAGGMIGAGEVTWPYFLVSRPVLQTTHLLARLGLISGFANDFAPVGVDEDIIRAAVVAEVGRLAEAANVTLIFLDPNDYLPQRFVDALPAAQRSLIHRIGRARFDQEVTRPADLLPLHERKLPDDPHFAPGVNRLVAEMLDRELRARGIVR